MTILVTGADGFLGRAVVRELASRPSLGPVRLFDRHEAACPEWRFTAMTGDLCQPTSIQMALDGCDTVLHLASMPGGAAEADPAASRRINVDATLALLEQLDARDRSSRFIYASSIAVFSDTRHPINDASVIAPATVYGAHKAMAELAVADFARRGRVETLALRLPGLVARPVDAGGHRSAFLSDLFHAAAHDRDQIVPVTAAATTWLMSVRRAAANLVHALDLTKLDGTAVTLPALRLTIGQLVTALFNPVKCIQYQPDHALEAVFGTLPALTTALADTLDFRHDGTMAALVGTAMADIAR